MPTWDDLALEQQSADMAKFSAFAKACWPQSRQWLLHRWCSVVGNKRVQGAGRVLGSIAGGVAKRTSCNVLIVHTHK